MPPHLCSPLRTEAKAINVYCLLDSVDTREPKYCKKQGLKCSSGKYINPSFNGLVLRSSGVHHERKAKEKKGLVQSFFGKYARLFVSLHVAGSVAPAVEKARSLIDNDGLERLSL